MKFICVFIFVAMYFVKFVRFFVFFETHCVSFISSFFSRSRFTASAAKAANRSARAGVGKLGSAGQGLTYARIPQAEIRYQTRPEAVRRGTYTSVPKVAQYQYGGVGKVAANNYKSVPGGGGGGGGDGNYASVPGANGAEYASVPGAKGSSSNPYGAYPDGKGDGDPYGSRADAVRGGDAKSGGGTQEISSIDAASYHQLPDASGADFESAEELANRYKQYMSVDKALFKANGPNPNA